MKKKKSHYHEQPKPVQPHLRVRLQSCFFDITYIFLNKECYLNRKRVAKSYCILYTCKCIFYIFASICVQVCSIFLLFGGGREVWARLGIVSLFTCVINSISFERYKTNLVPSFLPALSGSTCIISLANHYNTSVDAAIVRRLWCDDQVECMREEWGMVCRKCCCHFHGSVALLVGWGQWATLFFTIFTAVPENDLFPHIVYMVKAKLAFCEAPHFHWNYDSSPFQLRLCSP